MNIAFYGKGGIGKSTIASCVSVLLANKGEKILQIGCDPKHDSTLVLLGNKKITPLIDALDGNNICEDEIIVQKSIEEI